MIIALIILGVLFVAGYVWIFWELKHAATLDENDHIIIATLKNMRNIPDRLKSKFRNEDVFVDFKNSES